MTYAMALQNVNNRSYIKNMSLNSDIN